MGCDDYIDYDHYDRMQRRQGHYKILEALGFSIFSLQMNSASETNIGVCTDCGSMVWLGDLTRVSRLPNAYLHHGWHESLMHSA